MGGLGCPGRCSDVCELPILGVTMTFAAVNTVNEPIKTFVKYGKRVLGHCRGARGVGGGFHNASTLPRIQGGTRRFPDRNDARVKCCKGDLLYAKDPEFD